LHHTTEGTDGDFFSVGYNGNDSMTAVGVGFNEKTAARNEAAGGSCGPCITSVIDCRDPNTDVREGFIIEDMAVRDAFIYYQLVLVLDFLFRSHYTS
jgi:hypothetical protein